MTAPDLLDFGEGVKQRWRVKRERIGDTPEAWDITIPLTGRRGHVYLHSERFAAVFYVRNRAAATLRTLRDRIAGLVVMQDGDGEATARFPIEQLETALEVRRAMRRPRSAAACDTGGGGRKRSVRLHRSAAAVMLLIYVNRRPGAYPQLLLLVLQVS